MMCGQPFFKFGRICQSLEMKLEEEDQAAPDIAAGMLGFRAKMQPFRSVSSIRFENAQSMQGK